MADYGLREDGSKKGSGYFGALKRPDGDISTELSIGVNLGGKEVEIPSLVPTLSREEIDHLLNGGEPTPQIVQKAADFATQRMQQGRPVWATPSEEGATQLPQPSEEAFTQGFNSVLQPKQGSQ